MNLPQITAYARHALPIYKKNRIASLLCIFETTIADEIAEPRPDTNIKVAAFTVSEKSSNTRKESDPNDMIMVQ